MGSQNALLKAGMSNCAFVVAVIVEMQPLAVGGRPLLGKSSGSIQGSVKACHRYTKLRKEIYDSLGLSKQYLYYVFLSLFFLLWLCSLSFQECQ